MRNGSNASRVSDRPQLSKRDSGNDGSKRTSWYTLPNKFRQSYSAVNVDNIPEHEPEETFDMISPILAEEDRNIVLISRGTTPDEDADQGRRQLKTKRSSFTVLKHFTSNDREQLRRIGNAASERPNQLDKRRSQTVPFFKSKFMSSKPQLAPTNEYKDSCRPSDEDHSLGGFVNEYTISFDTCPVKESIRHQANGIEQQRYPPPERPRWAQNEGTRSFLNLSSVLKRDKKDRSEARVDEVHDTHIDEEDALFRRPHTRSQTAPEGLICDAAMRILEQKKVKKRRSVGGVLQSLFLPNHSMSMYQVAI